MGGWCGWGACAVGVGSAGTLPDRAVAMASAWLRVAGLGISAALENSNLARAQGKRGSPKWSRS